MSATATSQPSPLPVGRFAPSPTGRMHLGNIFTALISWLSVKSRGGRWVLRIEDLDTQRSRIDHARLIEDDLRWLGLDWDEGGLDDRGPAAPYSQSRRSDIYARYLQQLDSAGLTYGCRCRRADIMATQAPHQSDGRIIYAGTCRPRVMPATDTPYHTAPGLATRLWVPDADISFTDRIFGQCSFNLARDCGDFVVCRADGAWAYQLAVVVDDALMGITEVVRGCDLLLSAAQQIHLYRLLNLPAPAFAHLPLLCNTGGQRLSKRDNSLSMEQLRQRFTPRQLTGLLARLAGISPDGAPTTPASLINSFSWDKVPHCSAIAIDAGLAPAAMP